jgi:hypothetical protein
MTSASEHSRLALTRNYDSLEEALIGRTIEGIKISTHEIFKI